jgi:hypothetical protein
VVTNKTLKKRPLSSNDQELCKNDSNFAALQKVTGLSQNAEGLAAFFAWNRFPGIALAHRVNAQPGIKAF